MINAGFQKRRRRTRRNQSLDSSRFVCGKHEWSLETQALSLEREFLDFKAMVADLSSVSKGDDNKVVSQHHDPKSGENLNFSYSYSAR
jgi:hypothetical protein